MTAPEEPPKGYNPQIPQPDDGIGVSQGDFLINFMRLYSAYAQNHVPLDATQNAGNHTVIQLAEQATSFNTATSEISIYSKDVPGQEDQMFIRFQGNGKEIQYTNYQIYPVEHRVNIQAEYFTTLPGGLVVYFGVVFPNGTPFSLEIKPAICKTILSISLCPTNVSNAFVFPSNCSPVVNTDGFCNSIIMTPAQGILSAVGATNANQYYLVIGSIQ